jgi:hypothetical protein
MKVKYCIVLGCPRSGTTFLMTALRALANSECISGLLVPVSIPHLVNYSLPTYIYNVLAFELEASFQNYLDSGIPYSRFSALHKWLKGYMSSQEFFHALGRQRVIERIIYKEPFLSFAPEFTYRALPDCRILHLYRDGRDCADSLVRTYDVLTDEKLMALNTSEMPIGRKYDERYVPWWVEQGREEEFLGSTPYLRAIWMWKEMVGRCHHFFSKPEVVATGRVLLVKYEDLVSDSLKYGEFITLHFGAAMNAQLRKQLKQAHPLSIGIHKRRNPKEIEEAERIAKTELKLYGYL